MNIFYDASLKPFNTFGIEARAQAFVEVCTSAELQDALEHACAFDNVLVLGGGSNILFTRDFAGLVIRIALDGIGNVSDEDSSEYAVVEAGAGVPWDTLVQYCTSQNWGGVENLSLIPGSVGAAPVQNIGAYSAELKDTLVSVQGVMRPTGEARVLTNAECAFGYRDSVFKQELKDRFIITSVRLRLRKNPTPDTLNTSYGPIEQELATIPRNQRTVRDVSEAVRRIRRSKLPDPVLMGNAGSFFKNPLVPRTVFERIKEHHPEAPSFLANTASGEEMVKMPAGWLIEQCGWKGKRVGNTGSHAQQALVLVNYGGASGREIALLAQSIQSSVMERFGIRLDMEVSIL
jgi:UDP-N-acetylmuramate dehydrogenase